MRKSLIVSDQKRFCQEINGDLGKNKWYHTQNKVRNIGVISGVWARITDNWEWPNDMGDETKVNGRKIATIKEMVKNQSKKFSNQKRQGRDGVQRFWIKKIVTLHGTTQANLYYQISRKDVAEGVGIPKTSCFLGKLLWGIQEKTH